MAIASASLVIVCTCNRLFTRATCADWEKLYGEENVYCYLDGLGTSALKVVPVQRGAVR